MNRKDEVMLHIGFPFCCCFSGLVLKKVSGETRCVCGGGGLKGKERQCPGRFCSHQTSPAQSPWDNSTQNPDLRLSRTVLNCGDSVGGGGVLKIQVKKIQHLHTTLEPLVSNDQRETVTQDTATGKQCAKNLAKLVTNQKLDLPVGQSMSVIRNWTFLLGRASHWSEMGTSHWTEHVTDQKRELPVGQSMSVIRNWTFSFNTL